MLEFHICIHVFVQELAVSERQKRQAQQERDEMADEMTNSSSGKLVVQTFDIMSFRFCQLLGYSRDFTFMQERAV